MLAPSSRLVSPVLFLVLALVALVSLLAAAPSARAATCAPPPTGFPAGCVDTAASTYASTAPDFKGWATVVAAAPLLADWACVTRLIAYGACIQTATTLPAWKWTGTAWQAASRPVGEQVYTWPFAIGWTWTWTSTAGWLAMPANHILITAAFTKTVAGAHLPISYTLSSITGTTYYVATNGNNANVGTLTAPLASLGAALGKIALGATANIVVRGGTYREGNLSVYAGRTAKIMAYPGEIPVFRGDQDFSSGWVTEGAYQYHSYAPQPVTDGLGISFTTGQNLTGDGIGKRPDQAWVGSQQLRQVSAMTSLVDGTFFVDTTNSRMYLTATDVAKGSVAASKIDLFLGISGVNSSLEGVRVTRYSNSANDYGVIRILNPGNNVLLRNVEISETAFNALNLVGSPSLSAILKSPRLENITITNSNWMGIVAAWVDNGVLTNSKITNSNQFDEFTHDPVSGAIKTSRVRNLRILNNEITNNHSYGIWFDQSNYDNDVVGNRITGNLGAGVFYEISDNLLLANNYIQSSSSATSAAIKIAGSSGIKMVGNTIVSGRDTLGVYTDSRSLPGCADPSKPLCPGAWTDSRDSVRPYPSTLDWMPRIDLMLDNVIVYPSGAGYCGALTSVCITSSNSGATAPIGTIIHKADPTRGIPQTRMDGNVYANGSGSVVRTAIGSYSTISAFTAAMAGSPVNIAGIDATSKFGNTWVNANGTPTQALLDRSAEAVAIPVDAEINQYIPAGTKRYGYGF